MTGGAKPPPHIRRRSQKLILIETNMTCLRGCQFLLLLALMLLFAGVVQAQAPITWSLRTTPSPSIKPGYKFTAKVTAQMQGGWHIYSTTQGAGGPIPTRFTVPDGQPFKLAGAVSGPRPHVAMDSNFEIKTETYEGSAIFTVRLAVAADASARAQALNINVRYQACNDKNCLPPHTVKLSAPVILVAPSVALGPPSSAATLQTAKPSP